MNADHKYHQNWDLKNLKDYNFKSILSFIPAESQKHVRHAVGSAIKTHISINMKPWHKINHYSETACTASIYKGQQEEVEERREFASTWVNSSSSISSSVNDQQKSMSCQVIKTSLPHCLNVTGDWRSQRLGSAVSCFGLTMNGISWSQ